MAPSRPPRRRPGDSRSRTGPGADPARRKARQLARYLRAERPDYAYLKEVFRVSGWNTARLA